MFIWKNLKTYYNYNLKRILLSNFTKIEKLSNIMNIRLTSEESFKITHFLYMYLLSRKKAIPHLIQFNVPKKYKRQSQRLKPKYKGFCRLPKTTNWRILRKLYLIFYQYSAQETNGLNVKSNLCKLNLYNTMDTQEAKKLKSEKGYYPVTTMTYNFILNDADYFYKWFLIRLLKLNRENLTWYDSKLIAPVDSYSIYKEWLDSNIIELWNPSNENTILLDISDDTKYIAAHKEIVTAINEEESFFIEFCEDILLCNNLKDAFLQKKRNLFEMTNKFLYNNENATSIDVQDNIITEKKEDNFYLKDTIYLGFSSNAQYKEDKWLI